MSNYHVEPAARPQALTKEAIKSLRKEQVQGLSRRQLMRTAVGAGLGLWLLEVTAGSIGFLWPNLSGGFGGDYPIGTLDDVKLANAALPIAEGFPAYFADARAFVILVDPAQQRFIPGEDTTGDGTTVNVRALYQRCPHLGCKPNPCERNFWLECPCHGSRYDRLGVKADGAQYGPAPRGMDRFGVKVDGAGVLTIDTGKITLGPLPVALGQPRDHPAAHANGLHLMADTPAPPPTPEGEEPVQDQRLTVPESTPTEVVSADRFTSAPSTRAFALTPERAAQVVRQSSNARWVGFLATVVVILFVSIYWFYELGAPLGLTQPRLEAEATAQAITKVERGYNIYQANCARCHGVDGLGPNDDPPGIGPALNRQDKLFAHLNEDYLKNILTVGGRLACGNADSQMPVWADTNGGPLNYRQIEELIAYIRAPNDQDFVMRDEHLLDAIVDPVTGEEVTFTGWRDPNYAPEPGATPFPDCWTDELTGGGASATPGPSADPNAAVVDISTSTSTAFDQSEVTAPADTAFTIHFANNEAGVLHNVEVKDSGGTSLARGDFLTGVAEADYSVPALAAGDYTFICSVHPNMTGTLTAG